MSIKSDVIRIIAETLGIDQDEVEINTAFTDDLGCDEFDFTEIIMALEEEFEIEIDDNSADECITVNDMIELIKNSRV